MLIDELSLKMKSDPRILSLELEDWSEYQISDCASCLIKVLRQKLEYFRHLVIYQKGGASQ